jgi:hypothetical protein
MGTIPLIAIVGSLGAILIGTLYFLWVRVSKAK